MTTKENIAFGEQMTKKYYAWLVRLINARENLRPQDADGAIGNDGIRCILEIQEADITERVTNTEKKLIAMRKQYEQEMEVESAEANMHMNRIIADACPYVGKGPVGITNDIAALLQVWKDNFEDMEQELKNDIYFKLKAHVQFMKKTFNSKK